ncbi:MAG: 30S ribosomal protein S12 methylthiotransferase RimO, partial [Clostridia bacterium]|nr:30S ribosomal protein S12 methylthiotransferase RimO [Clostridia bacterium]
MAKTVKVGFISLGCSKNLCDTEVMLHHLVDAGYELTPEESDADVVIINTCAFIESAKKESIDNIIDIAWLKKHHTLKGIVVTGCLAERYREEIIKELPEVDAVLGVGGIHKIVEAVETVMANAS